MTGPISVEFCSGAGGQALGLEKAGFFHEALIDINSHCCHTLRTNRPNWNVIEASIAHIDGAEFKGVDLLAAGLPCPPFSLAGKQLGRNDERDLFPHALRLINEIRPKAVMIENVRGFLGKAFAPYREELFGDLQRMGYEVRYSLLNALDFGVPQARMRAIIIAIKKEFADKFNWPRRRHRKPPFVGDVLYDLMQENGWKKAGQWRKKAEGYAPVLVGGSTKHGGPDLGPTRSRKDWACLGVDGLGIADEAPPPGFTGLPRLTVRMTARLQGFPDSWKITGRKTAAYRQIGNAFPPPVAQAIGKEILKCLGVSHLEKAA